MEATQNKTQVSIIKRWLKTGSINLFGLPFAGKDTHGRELATLLDAALIGGGDILRSAKTSFNLQQHINKGNLAPTDEYLEIVLPYLARPEFKNRPLLLSSVGRWYGEETGVIEAAEQSGHPLRAVIYIKITESELHRRWQASVKREDRGRRLDDAVHLLETRIQEFKTKTLPVIDFYKDKGWLIEIDGMPARDIVTKDIFDQLLARAQESS